MAKSTETQWEILPGDTPVDEIMAKLAGHRADVQALADGLLAEDDHDEQPFLHQDNQRGPITGAKILFSPHRAEIDRMLFVEGRNFTAVTKVCNEEFDLKISRKAVANYATHHRDSDLRHALAVPGVVVQSELERDFRDSRDVLRLLKTQAKSLIETGQFKMADVVKAIDLEFKYFKPEIMSVLMETEERYRKALTAVMLAVSAHAPQDVRDAIQGELLHNADFIAAMQLQAAQDAD